MKSIVIFAEVYVAKHPGGVKMVCSSVALGLILWTIMQFGSQTVMMAAMDAGHALKGPMISIQSYLDAERPDLDSSLRIKRAVHRLPPIDAKELEAAVQFAQSVIDKMALHETNIADADVLVKEGTPGEGQLIESLPTTEALNHANHAMVALKASLHLANKYCYRLGIDDASCAKQISELSLMNTSLGKKCMNHYKNNLYCSELNTFRSVDGSCNHKSHSAWGRSMTPYRRLLPSRYEDSFHAMRGSRRSHNPPSSARAISSTVVQNLDRPDTSKTLAAMQWGQFIAHDVAHTAVSRMLNSGDSISCCGHNGMKLSPRHRHMLCAPIDISRDDPFYGELWKTCMPYVRSIVSMRTDCTFGPVDQMNQATHYLDGSVIYGSTNEVSASLRTFQNGRLRTEVREEKEFLPTAKEPSTVCAGNSSCYDSGDVRTNIYPGLTALHTIWVREHNRVAERLNIMNPMWDDERLFQEARRIVIAEIQHITYNEWLPVVLGVRYMKLVGLTINRKSYSAKFNEQIDPSVSNSFATAAMSFINSMVEGRLGLYEEDRNPQFVLLRDFFNKPSMLEDDSHLDDLIRGLATQSSQRMDLHYSDAMTNYLYKSNEDYGLDILSLDIQRGKDHGLPTYNEFRGLCGLPKAEDFADFSDTIPMEIISKWRKLYKNVDEVDLVIGGISENHEEGLVGPTFKCIISEQFVRTRTGDRFFYDVGGQAGSLNEAQLKQIKKSNLARIFCDNSDNIMNMQPYVFHKPATPNNDLVPCGEINLIDSVDLEPWRESSVPSLLP